MTRHAWSSLLGAPIPPGTGEGWARCSRCGQEAYLVPLPNGGEFAIDAAQDGAGEKGVDPDCSAVIAATVMAL